MTVEVWIKAAEEKLMSASVPTARLDCLVLLEDCLNTNRTQLLAHPEQKLCNEQINLLDGQIARRVAHEPLAYIRGKTEFYGREFIVNKHVLEPRPESETMIDLLKNLLQHNPFTSGVRPWKLIDMGTGSGCLGITAKLENPKLDVDLIDIDPQALKIAQRNAKKSATGVHCLKGDLLSDVPKSYDIILANLPYVPDNFQINPAALHEPQLAIYGGLDGLDVYRRLFNQVEKIKTKPRIVLTEALPPQHTELAKIAGAAGFKLTKTDDFIQQFESSI
jgi:release factor glutamine methyltransferase